MTRYLIPILGVMLAGGGAIARADVVLYTHPHPIAPGIHKGMCHIEGRHLHSYSPHKPKLYVKVKGRFAFVGDPVEFEPRVKRYGYYGHHPLFWVSASAEEVEPYCYITGPHHHWYVPPPTLEFKSRGGVHWYVGVHPRWYKKRYRRHRHIDRHYARVRYTRPVVTVAPPSGFVGIVIGPRGRGRVRGVVHGDVHLVPHPVHVHVVGHPADVHVVAPGAGVRVVAPRVGVGIHVPRVGVVFGGGVRHSPRHRRGRVKHRHGRRRGPPSHAPAWGHRKHRGHGHGRRHGKGKKRGKRK